MVFDELGQSSEHSFLSPQGKCPKPAISYPNVLQPSAAALLDPMSKTTWVGLSVGARVWEDNLPLLCNHGLGWSAQPRQPPGDKAHALGQRPEPYGRPGVGLSWKGDNSRGHWRPSGSQGRETRWQLPRGLRTRKARRGVAALSQAFGATCRHQRIRNLYFGNLAARARFFVFSVIISLLFSLSI